MSLIEFMYLKNAVLAIAICTNVKDQSSLSNMSSVQNVRLLLKCPFQQRTEERKIAIAVRAHPTIELLEDRLYVVTCGRAGFQVL